MNFDNILVKAKEVFETAYKKADDVVSAQKQKFDISSLEAKLSKDFEALGRIYFEAVCKEQNPEGEEAEKLIKAIAEKTAQIEEMKKEVFKSKNKKICPECGAALDKNSLYCSVCGVKISEEE